MTVPSFVDSCRFFPAAGGTADFTYSSAVGGYQSPGAAGIVNGNTYSYRAESADLTQWEIGQGVYNTSTGILSRTTVLFNSSGTGTGSGQSGAGAKINFTSVLQVAIVALSEDLNNFLVGSNNLSDLGSAATGRSNLGLGTAATQNVSAFLQPSNNLSDVSTAATALNNIAGVSYGASQSLTSTDAVGSPSQQTQARENVYAAPFDALAYNGMQISGSMEIDQPNGGASISFGTGTVSLHTVDGWNVGKVGTNAFTIQQVASVFPGYNNELKLTITTAEPSIGTDSIIIAQTIEGYRFVRSGWGTTNAQPVSVGFWLKSSVAGSLTIQITDNVAHASTTSVTINATNTAQFVVATFASQTAWSNAFTNNACATLNIFVAKSGSINIAATVGNTFEMTGVIILPGIEVPSASRAPFIMRPFDQELQLCQRYYQQIRPAAISSATVTSATAINLQIKPTPVMRTTPTLTLLKTSVSAGAFELGIAGSWFTASGLTLGVTNGGPDSFAVPWNGFSGLPSVMNNALINFETEFIVMDARL